MRIEHVPLLAVQRELYDEPDPRRRFQRYLQVMTGGSDDIELPLALMNPMGKAHVPEHLDRLLELGAEAVAARAVEAARPRLAAAPGEVRLVLVVADDRGGGWTNRYLTETAHRFPERSGELNRGWATALCFTGDPPDPESVRIETLSTLYRAAHREVFGPPRTLAEILDQEGAALAFAGVRPGLEAAELEVASEILSPYRDSRHFPEIFSCLYGDRPAESLGYESLGLPTRAGFEVGLAEALARGGAPEARLARQEASR